MENKTKMEIILVAMSGLVTLGLSINAILVANEKDVKLKQEQNLSRELQNKHSSEIQAKSDQIIELQRQLQEKSNQQLSELNRIKNPIGEDIGISLESYLILEKSEIDDIRTALSKQQNPGGNHLPITTSFKGKGIEKVNLLKDAGFSLTIKLSSGSRQLLITYFASPVPIDGQVSGNRGLFILALVENDVHFTSINFKANSFKANYSSPSLVDFENSDAEISYGYSYPQLYNTGDNVTKRYVENNNILQLDIKSLTLFLNGQSVKIENLKKIDMNRYTGNCFIPIN